jgi:hypothetical protein
MMVVLRKSSAPAAWFTSSVPTRIFNDKAKSTPSVRQPL